MKDLNERPKVLSQECRPQTPQVAARALHTGTTFRHRPAPRRPTATPTAMYENDPLWKLRHALAGVALAVLASVFIAALAAAALGDALGGGYGLRAGLYTGALLYVVAGAVALFVKVARHETRPLSAGRLLRWIASLWLWPLLLLAARRRASPPDTAAGPPGPG